MLIILKHQKLTLLWTLFVLIICNISIGNIEHTGSMFFPGFDKLVHCGLFFVFTVLLATGRLRRTGVLNFAYMIAAVAAGTAFGGFVEILQLWVFTWRDGNWADLFADFVGASMAGFCILVTLASSKYEKM
ncbi:VanZ family protein [Mucilaginibacter sp.]